MFFNKEIWRFIETDAQRYIDHSEISPRWYNKRDSWKWKFYLWANALAVRNHRLAFLFWFRILQFHYQGG